MKKESTKTLKKKADNLWSELIMTQAGNKCEVCGEQGHDPHHFIARSRSSRLRWNPKNGIYLCRICHTKLHWHHDPQIVDKIIRKRGQDWADELYSVRDLPIEFSYLNIKYLKGIIIGLKEFLK